MTYVRVKDRDTGHEYSMPDGTFDPATVDVLDKPAADPGGEPLPVKYYTSVSTEAAKKSGQAATPKGK